MAESLKKIVSVTRRPKAVKDSALFWEELYKRGGTSGSGSYAHLAEFKAEVINQFVEDHKLSTVAELGSGDGNQLSLANYASYTGFDISHTAVERCRAKFAHDDTKLFRAYGELETSNEWQGSFDLALSLDVIYHLIEDCVYQDYMSKLFSLSDKWVIVYSSDADQSSRWPEVRHRAFTQWVEQHRPDWELVTVLPQRYPWEPSNPGGTSWCDFYFFAKPI